MMNDSTTSAALWGQRADRIQASLDVYFAAGGEQLLHNWHPLEAGDDDTFNYWWLAHALEARLDAFERTGDAKWREAAIAVRDNILSRNDGSLFNDYFDDMLWFGIALLRLHEATSDRRHLDEATQIWHHVLDQGWNEECGGGIAWRKQQLSYKNTPSNGTFVILGARLGRMTRDPVYLDWARKAFDWLEKTLRTEDGFVEDGVNRVNDGRIDTQWRFTYNQGLYIGACVELAAACDDPGLLDRALATARTGFRELSAGGVLLDDGTGGDEGLFKGIMYRYAGLLAQAYPAASDIRDLILASGRILWTQSLAGDSLLAGSDWRAPTPANAHVPYSAQLSAIIGTEVCWRLSD